jgi:hypothetical protein
MSTKQELYERASELGIVGRSRMSKSELESAIGARRTMKASARTPRDRRKNAKRLRRRVEELPAEDIAAILRHRVAAHGLEQRALWANTTRLRRKTTRMRIANEAQRESKKEVAAQRRITKRLLDAGFGEEVIESAVMELAEQWDRIARARQSQLRRAPSVPYHLR